MINYCCNAVDGLNFLRLCLQIEIIIDEQFYYWCIFILHQTRSHCEDVGFTSKYICQCHKF